MNATKKSFIYWIASISRKWYPQITTLLSIRLTEKLLRVVIHPALGKKPEDFIETIIPYDGDLKIQINTGSFLEWQLFFHGYYEPEIINYIKKYLPKGGTFVDVGANVGMHSLIASKTVGANGNVIALEPVGTHMERLMRNFELNGLNNAVFLQLAASDVGGKALFYLPKSEDKGIGSLYKDTKNFLEGDIEESLVKTKTLDEILKDKTRVDFIKIDTEGNDGKVLMGALKTIEKFQPVIIFEYTDINFTAPKVTMEMVKQGLKGYSFTRIGARTDNCNYLCLPHI